MHDCTLYNTPSHDVMPRIALRYPSLPLISETEPFRRTKQIWGLWILPELSKIVLHPYLRADLPTAFKGVQSCAVTSFGAFWLSLS